MNVLLNPPAPTLPGRNCLSESYSVQPSLEPITVEHIPEIDGALTTVLAYRRPDGWLQGPAEQAHQELVNKILLDLAHHIPEVKAYHEINARDDDCGDEKAKINLDLEQVELDKRKALADRTLTGFALTARLAELDHQKEFLKSKLDILSHGRSIFRSEVSDVRKQAEVAVKRLLKENAPQIFEEAQKQLKNAMDRLKVHPIVYELLDNVATAQRFVDLAETGLNGVRISERDSGFISDYQRRLMRVAMEPPAETPAA